MAYTVKQVAEMSGVSVRALHFYDQTGLLKPAYLGANGYRFYEEAEILTLQQILFYRELGFELKRIKEILCQAEFEKVGALQTHKEVLEKNLTRTRTLIGTIQKTIEHLKGGQKMNTQEMFAGFSVAAGEDRFGEHIKVGGPSGDPIDCKLSAQDTKGAMVVFEFHCRCGGPRHLHEDQDEWIYIIEGEFEFHIGKERRRSRLSAGESIFIPRKTAHVWACMSEQPGKIINTYQPAGKMEEFFREVGKPIEGSISAEELVNKTYSDGQVEAMHQLFGAHGMHLLGPPLGFE